MDLEIPRAKTELKAELGWLLVWTVSAE